METGKASHMRLHIEKLNVLHHHAKYIPLDYIVLSTYSLITHCPSTPCSRWRLVHFGIVHHLAIEHPFGDWPLTKIWCRVQPEVFAITDDAM